MFEHPMEESLTNTVEIPDIEPEVFQELHRYVYTGQVSDEQIGEKAVELLAAADKYDFQELKRDCGNSLSYRMSPENCMKLLSLSENHPAYYLREEAVNYVRQFPLQVKSTGTWKKAAKENPLWIVSIMEMLLETPNIL